MLINANIEKIEIIAEGLGDLLDEVVFVGGAVASLYIDDPAAIYVRATNDVDCIIQLSGRVEFSRFEEKLRKLGFRNDTSEGAPICRWIYRETLVDVTPTDEAILGFSNQWYKEGIENCIKVGLPEGGEISLLSLPYFIATKIEAFHGRDESDFRISHDIEDIIIVLDGVLEFDTLFEANESVKGFLIEQFSEFMKESTFIESVSSHIEQGKSPLRTKRIMDFLKEFCGKDIKY